MEEYHDFYVDTINPDFLDESIRHLGTAVLLNEKQLGYHVIRIFGDPDFILFAVEKQGYGKVIGEVGKVQPKPKYDEYLKKINLTQPQITMGIDWYRGSLDIAIAERNKGIIKAEYFDADFQQSINVVRKIADEFSPDVILLDAPFGAHLHDELRKVGLKVELFTGGAMTHQEIRYHTGQDDLEKALALWALAQ